MGEIKLLKMLAELCYVHLSYLFNIPWTEHFANPIVTIVVMPKALAHRKIEPKLLALLEFSIRRNN